MPRERNSMRALTGRLADITMVLDNASIHKAKVGEKWLKEHPHLELLYLPTYSGHTENPVEKVWWRLKGHVAANRLHGNIDSLVAAVHDFFAAFTPEAALQLAASKQKELMQSYLG